MQTGRFTLKKVGTTENVSEMTTKYHDEERLEALMRMEVCDLPEDFDTQPPRLMKAGRGERGPENTSFRTRREHPEIGKLDIEPGESRRMVSGQSSLKDVWPGGAKNIIPRLR